MFLARDVPATCLGVRFRSDLGHIYLARSLRREVPPLSPGAKPKRCSEKSHLLPKTRNENQLPQVIPKIFALFFPPFKKNDWSVCLSPPALILRVLSSSYGELDARVNVFNQFLLFLVFSLALSDGLMACFSRSVKSGPAPPNLPRTNVKRIFGF